MKKGQTIEILSFISLIVVIIISILTLTFLTTEEKAEVMETTQESQEIEHFNSGVNTLMFITESASKKTFVELIGLMGFFENETLDIGPTDSPTTLNVSEELTERLDLIYGKGNWYLEIPLAQKYQIYVILLLDTSSSMKEEIKEISNKITSIIEEVKETTDKRVAYELYFLPGTHESEYRNWFNPVTTQYPNFETYAFTSCTLGSNANEAWAKAMKCLIDDKAAEWGEFTAKVGIILSDEPPSGCEDCGCTYYGGDKKEACCPDIQSCENNDIPGCETKQNDIQSLIDRANKDDVKMNIFTMKADPCTVPSALMSQCNAGPYPFTCAGDDELEGFMTDLSEGTNAKMFKTKTPKEVTDALREIVLSRPISKTPFKLGSTQPADKRIHSSIIPIPTPMPDIYINVTLTQWN